MNLSGGLVFGKLLTCDETFGIDAMKAADGGPHIVTTFSFHRLLLVS